MRLDELLVRRQAGLGGELTVKTLGDEPDQEQDVGDEVDSLNYGEDAPQRVDHAQRCC